jgi:hypothetical protein
MLRAVLMGLVLLVPGPALWARDDPKDKPKADKSPPSAQEEYSSLAKEHRAEQQKLVNEIQATKNAEDRQKLVKQYIKLGEKYSGRFVALAEKYPKDPVAVDALIWVLNNNRSPGSKDLEKAVSLLIKDYTKDKKMAQVSQQLPYLSPSEAGVKLLRAVLEKNPDREAKGQACLGLAKVLKSQSEMAARDKKPDADKLAKEAEKYFEEVVQKYGDLKTFQGTLEKQAKGELYELKHLTVGKQAPEIEGEDVDGKKFKLSDYRGKVVLLDFWGNW